MKEKTDKTILGGILFLTGILFMIFSVMLFIELFNLFNSHMNELIERFVASKELIGSLTLINTLGIMGIYYLILFSIGKRSEKIGREIMKKTLSEKNYKNLRNYLIFLAVVIVLVKILKTLLFQSHYGLILKD